MKAPLSLAFMLLLSGALLCHAETITISLTSTSSAEIVEDDAPASVQVTYQQTGGNGKGWFTAGSTGDLIVTGMPSGVITSVLVYMRSNKKEGAGQVSLTLNSSQLFSFSGSFADWQGTGFSNTFLPFAAVGSWRIDKDALLQLHIVSTENSVYLGQVEIEYTPDPAVAQCLELRWLQGQTFCRKQMCEPVAGGGVVLPDVSDEDRTVVRDGQTYRFVGWTDQVVEQASAMPFTCLPKSRYYVTEDRIVLFALYKIQNDNELVTHNDLTDGEYALALNTGLGTLAIASGRVKEGTVPTTVAALQRNNDGLVKWNAASVGEDLRYILSVNGDSVTIYHPSSLSYLGYNNSGSLSTSVRAWAWQPVGKGTIILYHDKSGSSTKRGLGIKDSGNGFLISEKVIMWSEESEGVFAFPLDNVSSEEYVACYTTFPSVTPLTESTVPVTHKKELRNGHIVIRSEQHTYNLSGFPID